MSEKRAALFLDRDGTINEDLVYINDPKLIALIPGAAKAIRKAQDAGFLIVVVSNQSGVGRGIIDVNVLPAINARVDALLKQDSGASIDLYQMCIHSPLEHCDCRKPNPKLVVDAAEKLGIDIQKSAFIGDKLTDIATGTRAGCGATILVRTGKGASEEKLIALSSKEEAPDYVADDLSSALDWFLASSKKRSSNT